MPNIYIKNFNPIIKTQKYNNKIGEMFEQYFTKEDIQIPREYVRICSTFLVIRKIHTKTINEI